jgi:serine/threonine-protein kinase
MTGTPQQGSVLGGRYALIEHLASGGMGDVWRATDGVLDRVVAVKVLKPELFEDPAFRERFRREARHAGSLSHPGIAAVFDYGEEARSAYLVMELIPGEPLSTVLARRGALPAEAVTSLLRQAAAALGAAHHAGIVHRDVKPGNILLQPNGQVKITDFGIARALGASTLTLHGHVLGTATYLSPEQAAGRTATTASDVYSLGVVAYEALSGRPPFEGEAVSVALAHTQQAPPPLPATVPPALRGVIARAMAKRPADRPPDGDALAAMLPPVSGGDDRTLLQATVPTSTASIAPVALDRTQPAVFGPTEPAVFGPTEPAVFGPTERAVPLVTTAKAPLRRRSRVPVLLAALAGLVAAAIVFTAWTLAADRSPSSGLVTDTTAAANATSTPRTTTTAAPTTTSASTTVIATMVVDPRDYLGRKADKAAKELHGLGFEVEQELVERGDRRPGIVVAVQPSGPLRDGSTVTLVVTASGHEN